MDSHNHLCLPATDYLPTYFYANGKLGQWPVWLMGLAFLLICGPLVVLALAAAGGLACGRMCERKTLRTLSLVYYTGAHMLIMTEPRFHLPLAPMVTVLATYFFIERPCQGSRPWQRGLSSLLIILLLANWALELTQGWNTLVALFGPEGHRLYLPY